MLLLNYPRNQKRAISRKSYIEALKAGENVAVLGERKSGKTQLIAEHIDWILQRDKEVIPVHISLDRASLNPENLAVELLGNICFWFLGGKSAEYRRFLDINFLKNLELGKNSSEVINVIANELEKIKPDQRLLLRKAFEFSESLAKDSKKKFLIVMEEFERILDLDNFPQIKDVFSILNFRKQNTRFLISSSFPQLIGNYLKDFKSLEIKNLDRKEAAELAKAEELADSKSVDDIYDYTNGQIFLTKKLIKRYKVTKNVKKALLLELSLKDSSSFSLCREIVEQSLSKARGATLLHSILKVLAEENGLKLSEIARRIYHSAPVTKSLLSRLMEVNLVVKNDSRFMFSSRIVGLWLRMQSRGMEFDEMPNEDEMKQMEALL
ncbi:hypothetical protein JXA85_02825 [Candidatus Woesearchaeota archaeon]|nr:hypothetical protein [Candidatus Woesearchaeota archaeon]